MDLGQCLLDASGSRVAIVLRKGLSDHVAVDEENLLDGLDGVFHRVLDRRGLSLAQTP